MLVMYVADNLISFYQSYDRFPMNTMDTTKRNDVAELTRLGLSDCWLLELQA